MTTNKFRKFFRSLKLLYGLFDEALQKQKKKKTILLTYRFFRRGREREREREGFVHCDQTPIYQVVSSVT